MDDDIRKNKKKQSDKKYKMESGKFHPIAFSYNTDEWEQLIAPALSDADLPYATLVKALVRNYLIETGNVTAEEYDSIADRNNRSWISQVSARMPELLKD